MREAGLEERIEVDSAGTHAYHGSPAASAPRLEPLGPCPPKESFPIKVDQPTPFYLEQFDTSMDLQQIAFRSFCTDDFVSHYCG